MSAPQEENFQAPPPPPQAPPLAPRPTRLRPFAIAAFVLGVIVAGGTAAKLIPAGYSTGGALCFVGILLFALSFIRLPGLPDTEPPLSWFEKVTGIFYEPTRVFRNLRIHPLWAGAFLTIAVLTSIYSIAFVQRITPERIVEHTTSKMSEMGALAPPPDRIEDIKNQQLEALKQPAQRVGAVVRSWIGLFTLGVFSAALALLGVLAFGGRINFWQSLAASFYAALPIAVIQKVLGLVILYLKSPDDLHPILNQDTTLQDNLGILLTPADHPVLFVLASFIGFTSLYWLWLRARGLHSTGTRVSTGQGWGVAILLWALLLTFAVTITALFPGFIS